MATVPYGPRYQCDASGCRREVAGLSANRISATLSRNLSCEWDDYRGRFNCAAGARKSITASALARLSRSSRDLAASASQIPASALGGATPNGFSTNFAGGPQGVPHYSVNNGTATAVPIGQSGGQVQYGVYNNSTYSQMQQDLGTNPDDW